VTVAAPPRRPEIERDRDLGEQVGAELEALFEEARRRARRRRMRNGAAAALAAGIVILIGFGGRGDDGGVAAALAPLPGAHSPVPNTQATPPLSNLPTGIGVTSFAFDPRTPDTVYAAAMGVTAADVRNTPGYVSDTRGYVYKSVDGGQHWQSTATTGVGWTRADTLAADPRHPGRLYAGNVVAVYKTVDGGRSWRPWNRGLFPAPGEISRTPGPNFHFGTPGTISWNRGEGHVTDIAVDPGNSNIVYSATDAILKSTDAGHTWKTVFRPPGDVILPRLVIAATRPEAIYAMVGKANGSVAIHKSTDDGASWHATGARGGVFPNGSGWPAALAVDPQEPTTVYAAIDHTVVKTTNAGASWQPILRSLPEHDVYALAVDPQLPGRVYAGVHSGEGTGAIYETSDGGRTWRLAVSTVAVGAIAVNPSRPTTIYAAGWAGADARTCTFVTATSRTCTYESTFRLLRSTDRGRTWTIAR
jgi:photosystem II stability/assembly factor-like uncharacterized protein